MEKILFIAGTRPEAIKLAPLYLEIRRRGVFEAVMVITGQHPVLAAEALSAFGIKAEVTLELPDHHSDAPRPLSLLLGELCRLLGPVIATRNPKYVVVQGDTTSALAGALTAFYEKIPVAHIEAGLRTSAIGAPFPEEGNRRLVTRVADLHFAPTIAARENLMREGVPSAAIHLTGNTGIDALLRMVRRNETSINKPGITHFTISADDNSDSSNQSDPNTTLDANDQIALQPTPFALVTAHRRENWGEPMNHLCNAIAQAAINFPEFHFLCVLHPNPIARRPFETQLADMPNIRLVEPLDYASNVAMMQACSFIITDSGGLQEEAPALGKPILVVREESERPEAITAGAAILVGSDQDRILKAITLLITNRDHYRRMATPRAIFGDGHASERIADILEGKRPTLREFIPADDEEL